MKVKVNKIELTRKDNGDVEVKAYAFKQVQGEYTAINGNTVMESIYNYESIVYSINPNEEKAKEFFKSIADQVDSADIDNKL